MDRGKNDFTQMTFSVTGLEERMCIVWEKGVVGLFHVAKTNLKAFSVMGKIYFKSIQRKHIPQYIY